RLEPLRSARKGPGDRAFSWSASEQAAERGEEREPGCASFLVRLLEPLREPRERGEVAAALECGPGAAGALQERERDRGLVREETEEVHLRERERAVLRPVEHLEHAEGLLVVEERDRHQPARHVARRLGGLAREPRVLRQVVDDERLARHEHPARDARVRREALADELTRALARDRLEHELLRLLVEQEDGGGLRAEDRARRLHRRLQERAERLVGADDACGDGCAEIAHVSTFDAARWSALFTWNGVSSRCLLRMSAQRPATCG